MATQDDHPLRRAERPHFEEGEPEIRLVDLFSGCGGLTLGVAQAAASLGARLRVPLAVDFEAHAVDVYAANFPQANVKLSTVEQFFDGPLGSGITETEEETIASCGSVDILVGGPPCQGHSNLNNHTRRNDPKNALYARMARAAEVLRPNFVLIENVPSVQRDRNSVVDVANRQLVSAGYRVAAGTISLHALGVAQTRRRHVLLAALGEIDPFAILGSLTSRAPEAETNMRWAIGDLEDLEDRQGYDIAAVPSLKNLDRMRYLLEHDVYDLPNHLRPKCHQGEHSYVSMYGRLRWDGPAQTITSGFGSIGQGRYMHPSSPRALTPHEAARLQGFPDYFDFGAVTKRGALATMIGNAVPPPLAREVATLAIPSIRRLPGATTSVAHGVLGLNNILERSAS